MVAGASQAQRAVDHRNQPAPRFDPVGSHKRARLRVEKTANAGFLMYIADAFGYLGTVAVLLIKEFISINYSWVNFFSFLFYSAAALGVVLIIVSLSTHSKLYKNLCNKNQPS